MNYVPNFEKVLSDYVMKPKGKPEKNTKYQYILRYIDIQESLGCIHSKTFICMMLI